MLEKMVSEQRLTKRLSDYWERLREGAAVPKYEKFNTAAIADMWDFCFVVKVDAEDKGKINYKYEYVGPQLVQAYGRDLTGQKVSSQIHTVPGSSILKKLDICVTDKVFLAEDGKFINDKSKVVKYRSCMLPFGSDAGVTHVIVGISWRAF